MELTVDALGQECPLPVVRAKQALGTIEEGTVEVLVDNQTAVHNLESLAKTLRCASATTDRGDGSFAVSITKDANSVQVAEGADATTGGTRVVVMSSDKMGSGDDELGEKLIKAFVFALTQQDVLPDTIVFYNSGVHLSCEGSEVLEDLQKLADAGVELLSCGVCLNHFGLEEKLAVGEVSNMYVILEKQLQAGVVVRP